MKFRQLKSKMLSALGALAIGFAVAMPIADADTYAFKYVNGHPSNTRLGLSTVMAFGVLADVATGTPRFLSELTLTTALRTAAMSVVAARVLARLARPDFGANPVADVRDA
jgi:ornithine cyclodeaminase/alanine dehydrogenase-like protein (mu-crystallin family)